MKYAESTASGTFTDNADTAIKGNKKARQINGLINEWYLEDLSENVRTVLSHKRANGQFIGSFATYGYLKDPDNRNRLVVDPVASEVVRRIFDMYLSGMGKTLIAEVLNSEGIPNPATYKKEMFGRRAIYSNSSSTKWNNTSISRILSERRKRQVSCTRWKDKMPGMWKCNEKIPNDL